jgi:hypothetical protein
LSTGWIGIVKNPSFMVCSSPKAGVLIGTERASFVA